MLGESIECLFVSLFIGHIMTEHVYMNTHSWIHYREDSFNQAYICRVKGHTHLGIRVNGIFNQTLTHIEEMKIGRGQACENTSSSPCFTQHCLQDSDHRAGDQGSDEQTSCQSVRIMAQTFKQCEIAHR